MNESLELQIIFVKLFKSFISLQKNTEGLKTALTSESHSQTSPVCFNLLKKWFFSKVFLAKTTTFLFQTFWVILENYKELGFGEKLLEKNKIKPYFSRCLAVFQKKCLGFEIELKEQE